MKNFVPVPNTNFWINPEEIYSFDLEKQSKREHVLEVIVCNKNTGELSFKFIEDEKKMNNKSLSFSEALVILKSGGKVSRAGWNGKNMYLELQKPDEYSKMQLPYVFIKTACGRFVPWVTSQSDLLSNDWEMIS